MLARAVVRHPVDDDADPARVRVREERVEVVERAEDRVDVAVVGDVVAEVGHRRAVERRQPDRLDAERLEVVETRRDPPQVADAIAVGVGERARVDLVDRPALPPGESSQAATLPSPLPERVSDKPSLALKRWSLSVSTQSRARSPALTSLAASTRATA